MEGSIILADKKSLEIGSHSNNGNVFLMGGSTYDIDRSFVLPNLMQMQMSYIVHDVGGYYLANTGRMFENGADHVIKQASKGFLKKSEEEIGYTDYQLRYLNVSDFTKSMHFNPLAYIKNDNDIIRITELILDEHKVPGADLLLQALIGYAKHFTDACTLGSIIDLLQASEDNKYATAIVKFRAASDGSVVQSADDVAMSAGDLAFMTVDDNEFCKKQYVQYRKLDDVTRQAAVAYLSSILAIYDVKEIREIISSDDMQLDQLSKKYMAIFVITDGVNSLYNPLIRLFYELAIDITLKQDNDCFTDADVKVPVQFLLNGLAASGLYVRNLRSALTGRSTNTYFAICERNISLFETVYGDKWETYPTACDNVIYYNSPELVAQQYFANRTNMDLHEMIEMDPEEDDKKRIDPVLLCYVSQIGEDLKESIYKYNLADHPRYGKIWDDGENPDNKFQMRLQGKAYEEMTEVVNEKARRDAEEAAKAADEKRKKEQEEAALQAGNLKEVTVSDALSGYFESKMKNSGLDYSARPSDDSDIRVYAVNAADMQKVQTIIAEVNASAAF